MNYKFVKRLADIFISLVCLPIVIPISIIVVILIKCNSKGPVIFKQQRIGLNCKPFIIYKFRTMKINLNRIEKQVYLCDGDIIFCGKFLRRFKLDELPQLFNILIGDMSFVGPRPCLDLTLKTMPQWALKRFDIKPGLTGLAQVNGNIKISWPERWNFDVIYSKKISFIMDIIIIFNTLFVLWNGEEIKKRFQ
mgnify:CR=1 FL=1|tara:strand:- start:1121 stop:1699 length:579 start_codon:yes stop_codon:yes gene_type:complete